MSGRFIDTNVLLYLASSDPMKADRAESVVAEGGTVSVQVLNEVANVARRKMGMSWEETHVFLATVRSLLDIVPVTLETHAAGLLLAERYGLSTYDAMIAAAALLADCETLLSEDMHDGLMIDGRLCITNPFR